MTTRQCAEFLNVSMEFIRGEIEDRRLEANKVQRPVRQGRQRSRPLIRIREDDFRAYVARYWPRHVERLPAA